jgi:putative transcriptional regulator
VWLLIVYLKAKFDQGRREPTGAARTLLKVAVKHPKLLRALET